MLVVTCAACCVINCAARRLRPSLTFNVTPVALAVPFLVWLSSTLCRAICRTGPFICLSSCCVRRPSHACRAVPLDVRAVCAPLVFTHLATHRMVATPVLPFLVSIPRVVHVLPFPVRRAARTTKQSSSRTSCTPFARIGRMICCLTAFAGTCASLARPVQAEGLISNDDN